MKLVTVAEMRAIESTAVDGGTTIEALMEAAGQAAAREAWMLVGGVPGEPVVVLAGPGNNGGDGLVAARHLHDWGCHVRAFAAGRREPDELSQALDERNVPLEPVDDEGGAAVLAEALGQARLVIDALLGTGVARPIAAGSPIGISLGLLKQAREQTVAPGLLALDLPTGLNADTGELDPLAVPADMTVAFGLAKVGMYQHPGAASTGTVEVVDIGLAPEAARAVGQELLDRRAVAGLLPTRRLDGNKGTFGRVLVVGGSKRYCGAILLTGRAAYRAGAGLVTIACPEPAQIAVASALAEATWLPQAATEDGTLAETVALALRSTWPGCDAAVIGPGMVDSESTRALTWAALPDAGALSGGVVIDADAVNALASMPDAADRIPPNAVLTPHPGEMSRLLGIPVAAVQSNRVAAARDAAARFGCTVVLKGAGTVIAAPGGFARISPFANPLLATAGTGDVLAGCIAGYLAQGLAPFDAATVGVFVHGMAAENLATRYGAAGMLAGELADALPAVVRELGE